MSCWIFAFIVVVERALFVSILKSFDATKNFFRCFCLFFFFVRFSFLALLWPDEKLRVSFTSFLYSLFCLFVVFVSMKQMLCLFGDFAISHPSTIFDYRLNYYRQLLVKERRDRVIWSFSFIFFSSFNFFVRVTIYGERKRKYILVRAGFWLCK